MHNDIILPISQGEFNGNRNEYGRICIGDTPIIHYKTKHTNRHTK